MGGPTPAHGRFHSGHTSSPGIIRRHRVQIGSPWRKLTPSRQALLVLACLCKGETFAELTTGLGIGTATAWRQVTETVALPAARFPKLPKPCARRRRRGTHTWYAGAGSHSADDPGAGRPQQPSHVASRDAARVRGGQRRPLPDRGEQHRYASARQDD